MAVCALCGKTYKQIVDNHLKKHGYTFKRYIEEFPNESTIDPEVSKKLLDHNALWYGNPDNIERMRVLSKESQSRPEVREKIKNTCMERYGSDTPMSSDIVKEKIRKTCMERYGVENPVYDKVIREKISKNVTNSYTPELIKLRSDQLKKQRASKEFNDKLRKTMEQRGEWIPLECMGEREIYNMLVSNITKNNYKKYKHIIDPNNLRSREYHIDHIYSKHMGFQNGIDPRIIGHYKNLRIYFGPENSSKGSRCDIDINTLLEWIEDSGDFIND